MTLFLFGSTVTYVRRERLSSLLSTSNLSRHSLSSEPYHRTSTTAGPPIPDILPAEIFEDVLDNFHVAFIPNPNTVPRTLLRIAAPSPPSNLLALASYCPIQRD